MLGVNSAELQIWAKEIVSEKAAIHKREMQLKERKAKDGFLGSLFGSNKKESEEERNAAMNRIEREIEEHAQKMSRISGNSLDRENVPDMQVSFTLKKTRFTIVNNMEEYKGVTL